MCAPIPQVIFKSAVSPAQLALDKQRAAKRLFMIATAYNIPLSRGAKTDLSAFPYLEKALKAKYESSI